jgi:hypothetical protein
MLPASICFCRHLCGETGSSVSIVSVYGLTTGRSRFDPRQRRKYFSCSLCVQTGRTVGTGGGSPGLKRGRGVMLTTHPHLMPRSRIPHLPPSASLTCSGTALALSSVWFKPPWVELCAEVIVARRPMQSGCTKIDAALSFLPFLKRCRDENIQSCFCVMFFQPRTNSDHNRILIQLQGLWR